MSWLERERALIGEDAVERLKNSRVLVFGCGGVGGFAIEALVRAGIGGLTVVDHDTVAESNLNRQIIATELNVGQPKVEAVHERVHIINSELRFRAVCEFADESNIARIIEEAAPDFIIDAIDSVTSKLIIAEVAVKNSIPLIASMGTGNKLDPSKFRICDISKTHTCPLARVMRRELAKRGISHLTVLFSEEQPVRTGMREPASISFVPSVAGLMIAGHCIRQIAGV
ncbi:MAG: tRNA threonylcarbamoyladenosine dehydratase [Clostridia bacterium]|nr:tRNA threonylcarbamoyladenosine dehydratase [Clostridia bacterium]